VTQKSREAPRKEERGQSQGIIHTNQNGDTNGRSKAGCRGGSQIRSDCPKRALIEKKKGVKSRHEENDCQRNRGFLAREVSNWPGRIQLKNE